MCAPRRSIRGGSRRSMSASPSLLRGPSMKRMPAPAWVRIGLNPGGPVAEGRELGQTGAGLTLDDLTGDNGPRICQQSAALAR